MLDLAPSLLKDFDMIGVSMDIGKHVRGLPDRIRLLERRRSGCGQDGFSMIELLVVVAVLGIMALIALPWWQTYVPAATLTGAARQVQAGLNQARQLAIGTRQNICVQTVLPNGLRLLQNGCGGAAWTGPGTDGAGTLWVASNVGIANAGPNPIFTSFGNAIQTATFTLTGPQAQTITVTVQPSGRVTIP